MLKHENQNAIRRLINSDNPDLGPGKEESIYRLIQSKGRSIQSNDTRFDNMKAVEFAKGEFVAIKRIGNDTKFFPCTLKTIYLK